MRRLISSSVKRRGGALAPALALALLAAPGGTGAQTIAEGEIDRAARMARPTTAEIDNTLAIGGEAIDARKVRSRMTVAVRINGTGPYRFVVDSGADTSVVGERLAGQLQLAPASRVLLNGVTESAWVGRVEVDKLSLGPTTVSYLQLPVLKDSDLGAEGMVGLDALVEQRLMLDFEKRTITVDDANRPAPRMDGEIVVTARLKRGQLILTQVRAGQTSVDAVVDTGSEITIGNSALRDQLMRRYSKSFETIEITGVTGAKSELQLIRIPELRIGPVTLRDVPIAFADITPFEVLGISDRPSLLLGTDLMETFRKVSLDFRARKVRFQLRKCAQTVQISTMPTRASRLTTDLGEACGR